MREKDLAMWLYEVSHVLRLWCAQLELGGTFYLPYRHHYSKEELVTAHPRIHEFFKLKRKLDPNNVFSNLWFEKYGPMFLESVARLPSRELHTTRMADSAASVAGVPSVSNRRTDSYLRLVSSEVCDAVRIAEYDIASLFMVSVLKLFCDQSMREKAWRMHILC